LEDVFDEIVKFSDKMSWEGGQKINRIDGFVQNKKKIKKKVVSSNNLKLLFYDFLFYCFTMVSLAKTWNSSENFRRYQNFKNL
jgi:hypothetical protein